MTNKRTIGLGHLRQSLENHKLRLNNRFKEDIEAIERQLYIIDQIEKKPEKQFNLSGGGMEFMEDEIAFCRRKIEQGKDWLHFVDGRRSAIEYKEGIKVGRREYIKYIEDKIKNG